MIPLAQGRCMTLLNATIEHMLVAEKLSEVIKQLLNIGFTEEELVGHFNFCKDDVDEVLKEMKEEEE